MFRSRWLRAIFFCGAGWFCCGGGLLFTGCGGGLLFAGTLLKPPPLMNLALQCGQLASAAGAEFPRALRGPCNTDVGGHGPCDLRSLPQPFAENSLPKIAPVAKGERGKSGRVMLERNRLDTFYRELQVPSRTEVKTTNP